MTTNILVILVLMNVVLAVFCTWQIQERFPKYYEEIGSPNYGVSGPGMFAFMFGHVLTFRYLSHTHGFVRIVTVAWSFILWAMLVGFVLHFA